MPANIKNNNNNCEQEYQAALFLQPFWPMLLFITCVYVEVELNTMIVAKHYL